ncbi:MAG: protein-export chaperone SecB [Alphaproteobacteria bacterium]|jgi:preprotein translocase subunit SecB|tara:strand:- start:11521 stop:11964 length:444 start_codon:yes stop_codon:yes gene_type:complete
MEKVQSNFKCLSQYIKDLSFENSKAPNTLPHLIGNPNISVGVNVNAISINNDKNVFEIELTINAQAKKNNEIVFIAELVYAGVIELINVDVNQKSFIVLVDGARMIFPFARRILADLVRDGGFPPLYIEPIDFLELYRNNIPSRLNS